MYYYYKHIISKKELSYRENAINMVRAGCLGFEITTGLFFSFINVMLM